MPNYHHVCHGVLNSSFGWSFGLYSESSLAEAAAESAWHSGIQAMFTTAAFAALLPTGVNVTGTSTSTMSTAWKQTTKTSTNSSIVGAATTALPYHTALVVSFQTAQATRYGRGRWYLPPLATTALATGGYSISSAAVGDVVSAVNAAWAAWGSNLQPLILHRRGTKSGPGPLTTDPITTGFVGDSWDVQRRRAEKRVESKTSLTL